MSENSRSGWGPPHWPTRAGTGRSDPVTVLEGSSAKSNTSMRVFFGAEASVPGATLQSSSRTIEGARGRGGGSHCLQSGDTEVTPMPTTQGVYLNR